MPKLLHCPDCGELGYRRKVKRPEWRCTEKSCGYEWDSEPEPLDSDEEQNSIEDNVDFSTRLAKIISALAVPLFLAFLAGISVLLAAVRNL